LTGNFAGFLRSSHFSKSLLFPLLIFISQRQQIFQQNIFIAPNCAGHSVKGSLFIGAMALHHLNRLAIRDNKVVHEEILLKI
jgi:hypothetical protein